MRRIPWFAAAVSIALSACSSPHPAGPSDGPVPARLVWTAPSNADGTPLRDLAGYRLHFDTVGRGNDPHHTYTHTVDIGMPSCAPLTDGGVECQTGLPDLPSSGTWFFAVTAYDRAIPPNESPPTGEVSFRK